MWCLSPTFGRHSFIVTSCPGLIEPACRQNTVMTETLGQERCCTRSALQIIKGRPPSITLTATAQTQDRLWPLSPHSLPPLAAAAVPQRLFHAASPTHAKSCRKEQLLVWRAQSRERAVCTSLQPRSENKDEVIKGREIKTEWVNCEWLKCRRGWTNRISFRLSNSCW